MGQLGRNTRVAFKVQAVANTAEIGAGATLFRFSDNTAGLVLSKAKVRSNESKANGMSVRGRHGSRSVAGTYPADATLGTYEALIAAALRTTPTWAAALVVTEATASLTSITTTTNTIVAAAGSWITAGLKLGDVFVLTNHVTAANNSKDFLITGLTAPAH